MEERVYSISGSHIRIPAWTAFSFQFILATSQWLTVVVMQWKADAFHGGGRATKSICKVCAGNMQAVHD